MALVIEAVFRGKEPNPGRSRVPSSRVLPSCDTSAEPENEPEGTPEMLKFIVPV